MDFLAAYLFTWLECSALGFHSFTLQGNVPCVLNVGLPWFLFPRAREIALSGEFSLWIEIAGIALF